MSTSTPSVLTDHVLYKLQDKATKMPRGFAFVKVDPILDNSSGGGFDFLPVSGDITTAMSSDQAEMIRLLEEAIYEDEYVKHEVGVVEADLNLSEASSTNDTTLDECRSVSSFLSPIIPPVKFNDDVGFASIRSEEALSKVETNGNIRFNENEPLIKTEYHDEDEKNIKSGNVFSPVVGSPRCVSLASFTVASLAAEVVSKIKTQEKNNESGITINKKEVIKSSSSKREEVEGYFRNGNVKENLSEEDFNKLNIPFSLGWKRECVVKENNIISDIYYITPPRGSVQGKRLRHPSSVTKFLSGEGNLTNLMLENFSFKKVFLGFESQHEFFRLAAGRVNRAKSSGDNKKYGNFFEFTDDKYRCLLCGNFVKHKGNMAGHVKRVHEPDVKCETCGKDFSAFHIENHQAICTNECKDINENKLNGIKRKAPQGSEKPNEKIIRVAELGSSIPEKSSSIKCRGSTSWASPITIEASNENYCEIIEPGDQDFHPITPNIELVNIEEPVPEQHENGYIIAQNTEEKTESFTAQNTEEETESFNSHEGSKSKILPQDQLPVPQEIISDIVSKKDSSIHTVTLEISSVEGTRVKMQMKVHAKLAKGMKKFGMRMGVSYQDLRFTLSGKELTGEESVEGLDGAQILVERRVG